MSRPNVSAHKIPLFSTYRQRENHVSHALAATFERCPRFRKLFLQEVARLAPRGKKASEVRSLARAYKRASVSAQCCFGMELGKDESAAKEVASKSIPDVAIVFPVAPSLDEKAPCILVEAKVCHEWDVSQAERHTKYASQKFNIVLGLAIAIVPNLPLPPNWIEFPWAKVYEVAGRSGTELGRELCRVLEITEAKLLNDTNLRGTMTVFSGIPFGEENPFSTIQARNTARLLRQALADYPKLKRLGISVDTSKQMSSGRSSEVWAEAEALDCFKALGLANTKKLPHLNFTVADDLLSAGITFPNQTFKQTLRNGVAALITADAFEDELARLLREFEALSSLCGIHKPRWYIAQNYYTSQRARPREDAYMRFDLRTFSLEKKRSSGSLRIKRNPGWTSAVASLITEAPPGAHLQSGIGVDFPYCGENQAFLSDATAICEAITIVWAALMPFALLMAQPTQTRSSRRKNRPAMAITV